MKSSPNHLPSLLSSLVFILGATLLSGASLLMGVSSLAALLTGENVQAQQTIILVVLGFEALILLIATFVSIQRFRGQPFAQQDSAFSIKAWHIGVSVILAGIAILIGYEIGANESVNWLLLPILTLPAVVLPLFVLLGLGIRGIPLGTRWQSWNVFGLSMTLAPFLLIFLEVFALFVVLIFVLAFLISQPDIVTDMERLSQQLYMLGPESKAAQNLVAPYITNPGVIAVALIYFAVLVPMMEEILKPLGVWFFARQLTSPAQGFALGALSGAAYGLIETLGASAQTDGWADLLLSRIGTGALHITTSALMGAAIVYAIRERGYLRLLGVYFLSISLHGLWNALALFFAFSTIAEYFQLDNSLNGIQTPLTIGMAVLAGIFLIILVLSNRRMRIAFPKPATGEELTP